MSAPWAATSKAFITRLSSDLAWNSGGRIIVKSEWSFTLTPAYCSRIRSRTSFSEAFLGVGSFFSLDFSRLLLILSKLLVLSYFSCFSELFSYFSLCFSYFSIVFSYFSLFLSIFSMFFSILASRLLSFVIFLLNIYSN